MALITLSDQPITPSKDCLDIWTLLLQHYFLSNEKYMVGQRSAKTALIYSFGRNNVYQLEGPCVTFSQKVTLLFLAS